MVPSKGCELLFCKSTHQTHDHLFFQCQYASDIWGIIRRKIKLRPKQVHRRRLSMIWLKRSITMAYRILLESCVQLQLSTSWFGSQRMGSQVQISLSSGIKGVFGIKEQASLFRLLQLHTILHVITMVVVLISWILTGQYCLLVYVVCTIGFGRDWNLYCTKQGVQTIQMYHKEGYSIVKGKWIR